MKLRQRKDLMYKMRGNKWGNADEKIYVLHHSSDIFIPRKPTGRLNFRNIGLTPRKLQRPVLRLTRPVQKIGTGDKKTDRTLNIPARGGSPAAASNASSPLYPGSRQERTGLLHFCGPRTDDRSKHARTSQKTFPEAKPNFFFQNITT